MVGLDCGAGRLPRPVGLLSCSRCLNSRALMLAHPPHRGETSTTLRWWSVTSHGRPSSYLPGQNVGFCRTTLDDVNAVLLQHAPDLLNILHIHAGNANTTLEPAVAVLNNFELKCDAVQTKNDFPAQ